MEHVLKEILSTATSEHFNIPVVPGEIPDFIDEWIPLALVLFSSKNIDTFWATNLKLRKQEDFVEPIKKFISKFMSQDSTEKQKHYNAQCIIGLVCANILIFTKNFGDRKEPQAELQHTETTGSAHRYFIGFLLLQLGKKFGHSHFKNFKTDHMEAAGDQELVESLWWTAGINRGGLIFCTDEVYKFFNYVLSIEDKYFKSAIKSTSQLKQKLLSDSEVNKKWAELPWLGSNLNLRQSSLKEAIRLHIGGRTRAFVKFVKDNHKSANRMARHKKPLREHLANNVKN